MRKRQILLEDFLQTLVDFGDISKMVEVYDKVKIGYELQKLIHELEEKGYYIFGEKDLEPMFIHQPKIEKWTVATVVIRRKENADIIKVDLGNI